MKKRPEWECGRISSRPCRTRRFRRIRQTDSRIPEQREEMARFRELKYRRGRQDSRIPEQREEMLRQRERKCLRDRRMGRRTKTNKIRMQEGSAVLRESVFPSFIFYSAKDGKNKFVFIFAEIHEKDKFVWYAVNKNRAERQKSIWVKKQISWILALGVGARRHFYISGDGGGGRGGNLHGRYF